MIEFKKITKNAEFYNPMYNFELKKQMVEFREDPLTGQNTIIPEALMDKVKMIIRSPSKKTLNEIIENTKRNCPFCPEKVLSQTPKFDINIAEGRIKIGNAIAFPNIFSFFENSAVIVLSNDHYLNLDEFIPEILVNAFKVARKYTKAILDDNNNIECNLILGCNYLYPAGSTVVHPHLQLYISENNFFYNKILLKESKRYFNENNRNYWEDLVETEKELKERYIAKLGTTEWMVPFAPLGVYEIQGIIKNQACLYEFSDENLEDLANGISNTLKYYNNKKVTSFNFALYSAPHTSLNDLATYKKYFWSSIRIIVRPNISKIPLNDVWFLPRLVYDNISPVQPEKLVPEIKEFFNQN
jgi:galactose-1-phosphate uridylyltransferase